jgi:lycopene cyclase domain-containing protein
MMRFEYALVLLFVLVFPLVLSFDRKLPLRRHPGALAKAIGGVAIPFWIWDLIATARGHWSFNEQYVAGAWLLGMPLEEWLFFLIVPFVSIFTWESTKYFLQRRP